MRQTILAIICFILCANCFSQQQGNDSLLSKRLDSIFLNYFRQGEPGGSILIEDGNHVIYSKSFGLADIKTKRKFTSSTISNIGSITKTFVAYGILILQNEGKLSIEDSIIKYFPDFKNKDIASKVRIKHLLTHTSGLPDNREVEKDSVFYLTANDEQNFAPLKLTDTLEFEPGSQWKYSNPAYNGLALIIEKVSGMKWQSFIKKYIFDPAGMRHSKITNGSYPQTGVAHGYRKVDGRYEEYDYGEYPTFSAAGNGGVWSSVEDLKKYVHALKNCLFLDCKTIRFSQSVWYPANWKGKDPPFQGFCWFIGQPRSKDEYTIINHSGGQGGFKANLYIIPEANITVIWLNNNDQSLTDVITEQLWNLGYIK